MGGRHCGDRSRWRDRIGAWIGQSGGASSRPTSGPHRTSSRAYRAGTDRRAEGLSGAGRLAGQRNRGRQDGRGLRAERSAAGQMNALILGLAAAVLAIAIHAALLRHLPRRWQLPFLPALLLCVLGALVFLIPAPDGPLRIESM